MKKFWKIVGRVLLVLVFLAIAILIARVLMQSDKSTLRRLSVNDTLRAAYPGGESAYALTHSVPYQISASAADPTGSGTGTPEDGDPESGYFSAYALVYVPGASQLQLVVKYNRYVYEKIGVAGGYEFTFVLRNGTTGEKILPTYTESAEKWMYQYRRLIFDGVTLDNRDDWWIDLQLTPESDALNCLVCHFAGQYPSMDAYRLSRSDKAALEAAD